MFQEQSLYILPGEAAFYEFFLTLLVLAGVLTVLTIRD